MSEEDHDPCSRMLSALDKGELNEAIALQGWYKIDLEPLQVTDRFRSALRTCVEIRCLMDGMTPTDIIQKASFLCGYRMNFSEEFARIGIDRPSDSEAEPVEHPKDWLVHRQWLRRRLSCR
jgi:hypothetical protein